MLTHKISGNLYNCAFNCALPILLQKIEYLHELEANDRLPCEEDTVYLNYKKIKDLFARRYGLNGAESESFTWSQFNTFLSIHTFPAQEILFAPVFRRFIAGSGGDIAIPAFDFMREVGLIDGYDSLNPEGVTLEHGIDPNTGKYLQLDFIVMEKGFYQQFGIKVNLLNFNEATKNYETNALYQVDESFVIPQSPLSSQDELGLYLKGGHYELQPHDQVDMDAYFFNTDLLSGSFDEVFKATTEDMSARRTNEALARLFIYVNRALNGALLSEAQDLQMYAQNGRQFYHPGQEGTLTFAVILLVIGTEMSSEDSSLYSHYLNYIQVLSDDSYDDAIALANAVVSSPCDLKTLEQDEAIKSIIEKTAVIIATSLESIPDDVSIMTYSSPSNQVDLTANFQFNCMIGLAAAGAILLCVAIACPPAAAIGLGVIGSVSLLASAGLFAYRQCGEERVPSASSCDLTPP